MSGAYHASVNVICFESCVLYRSGVILCCVRGGFPWRFMGGGGVVCEVDCKVSDWLTCTWGAAGFSDQNMGENSSPM